MQEKTQHTQKNTMELSTCACNSTLHFESEFESESESETKSESQKPKIET